MKRTYTPFISGHFLSPCFQRHAITNPANNIIEEDCCYATHSDVISAVDSARKAFKDWSETPIEQRASIINKAADLLVKDQGKIGDLIMTDIMQRIVTEMGKSVHEAEMEIFETADCLRYFANEGSLALKDEIIEVDQSIWPDKSCVIRRKPLGVVAIIKPWNYPLEIPAWSIGAALISGNTVVFKPSEITPGVGCFLAELFTLAGIPSGVLNVLTGADRVGAWLLDEQIDLISFTGSNAVGKKIERKCSQKGIPCVLELGGKDAAIICEDANVDRSVKGSIWGGLCNCGQVCVGSERYYVHESIYDDFLKKSTDLISSLVIGNGINPNTDLTCLVSESQLKSVEAQICDAVRHGATIVYGGKRASVKDQDNKGSLFYEPTIVTNVSDSMKLWTSETFGPIIAIQKYSDENDMISKVNASQFGLGASIWTTDMERATRISKQLDVGMVWINDVNICIPQCPWGGVKSSGRGRDLSKYSLYEYTTIQHIMYDNSDYSQPWWFPYYKET